MDVPIGAQVYCENELCGCSTHVILDPVMKRVTHIVVEQEGLLPTSRMVPIEWLAASTPDQLFLHCSKAELASTEHLAVSYPDARRLVPPHKLAIGWGTWAEAWDGYVGLVEEFTIEPDTYCLSYLVLRTGHSWGKRRIAVPVSAISRIEESRVVLRMNVDGVEDLPSTIVQYDSAERS